MKRIKKLLAFALALILTLSLAPIVAQADPPDDQCPSPYSRTGHHDWRIIEWDSPSCTENGYAKYRCEYCYATYEEVIPGGHDWTVWYYEGQENRDPTCTEPGVMTRHCDNCWTTEVVTIPALGHDWDGGLLLYSSGGILSERTIRYTCQRCGTVWDVTESSLDDLFQMLRRPKEKKDSALIVTLQPQGGAITRGSGETHTMTIAVEGGEEPYTYEWHRVDKARDSESQMAEYVTIHHNEELAELIAAYQEEREQALGIAGKLTGRGEMVPKEPVTDLEFANVNYFDPNDHKLGEGDGPSYTADRGDSEYYCVIRDSAGNWAVTDSAELRYRLRIVEEPESLDGKEGEGFHLRVADGVPPYDFEWWVDDVWGEAQPWQVEGADGPDLPLEDNLYDRMLFCRVTDTAGDTVESRKVYAYAGEKFALLDCSPHSEMRPNETKVLEVRFKGGVPPYTASWTKGDVPVEEQTSDAAEGPVFTLEISSTGWYCCTGRDGAGGEIPVLIHVDGKKLNILRQPQGGDLDESGVFVTDMEMENGEAPFTYTVRAYGVEPKVYSGQGKTPSFEITEPGSYWVYVEDANGQWAESEDFTVNKEGLHLIWMTDSYSQHYPNESAVLVVMVEGGRKPYTYDWDWIGAGGLKQTWSGLEEDYLYINLPGMYHCVVTDADGRKLNPPSITVSYSGDNPVILVQPHDTVTSYDGPGPVLNCTAASGTGNDEGLRYYWEVQTENGWSTVSDGTSQTYPVPNQGLGKLYRCRVYDTFTRGLTYSNTALAYDKLACVKSETVNGGRLSRWLFTGGVGPYRVTVSCYDPYASKTEDAYQVLESYIVSSLGWLSYPHSSSTTCAYIMTIRDYMGEEVSPMAPVKGS